LDELDVDSAPASAFLILKSFKMIPLQLGCRVPARVLACLLLGGPVAAKAGRMTSRVERRELTKCAFPSTSSRVTHVSSL
jgi:hypothetical protein